MPRKLRIFCLVKKNSIKFFGYFILIFLFFYFVLPLHVQGLIGVFSKMSWESTLNLFDVGNMKPLTKNEQILEKIASNLEIQYEVLSNFDYEGKIHQIKLINHGESPISKGNESTWSIFFNDIHLPEYNALSYSDKYKLPGFDFELHHVDGGLFALKPTLDFKGLDPNEAMTIEIHNHATVSRDYISPRWYIASPGGRPFIIKRTNNDPVTFVKPFNAPRQWKRSATDKEDPLSLGKRFEKYFTNDMESAPLRIVPSPIDYRFDEMNFVTLNSGEWVVCDKPALFKSEMELVANIFGLQLVGQGEPCPPDHVIKFEQGVVPGVKLVDEAYQIILSSARNTIEITSPGRSGAFYAVQTLLSLAEGNTSHFFHKLPSGTIRDSPRYSYRGLHLDSSRNFIKQPDLLNIMKTMATYKLNKLHLHLTDDEGWRIEIKGLPELTRVGSVRRHCDKELDAIFPALGSGPFSDTSGSGFYSVSDYQEILRVASANHIQVIPEIDVPGHSHAAIRSMEARYRRLMKEGQPEAAREFLLSDLDDRSSAMSVQHYSNNAINPCMESTYRFLDHVIGALKKMHEPIQPLTTVHVGGDEVAKRSWAASPICTKFIGEAQSFPYSKADLQEYFMRRTADICKNKHGLAMGVWEEGALSGRDLPYKKSTLHDCDVTANAWNNAWQKESCGRAYKLANAGYKVVMSQSSHLYFDHPQEPDPEEKGLTWATRYIDDRMVFDFKPDDLYSNAVHNVHGFPYTDSELERIRENNPQLDPDKSDNIIGMQAQLWTEMLRDATMVHSQLFPRLIAFAERAWHKADWEESKTSSSEDWTEFANVVGYKELARLKKRKIHYRIPPPGVKVIDGKFQVCSLYPGFQYFYRPITDGDDTSWIRFRSGDPVPAKASKLEFVTSDGVRRSRIVKATSQ